MNPELRELVAEAKERCLRQCKNPDDRNELFVSLSLALESMVHEGVMELEVLASIAALVIVYPGVGFKEFASCGK